MSRASRCARALLSMAALFGGCATQAELDARAPEVAIQRRLDRIPVCSPEAQRTAVPTVDAGMTGQMAAAGHLEIRFKGGCDEGDSARCWGPFLFVAAGDPQMVFELVMPRERDLEWTSDRDALTRVKTHQPLLQVLITGAPAEAGWHEQRDPMWPPAWKLKAICAIRTAHGNTVAEPPATAAKN